MKKLPFWLSILLAVLGLGAFLYSEQIDEVTEQSLPLPAELEPEPDIRFPIPQRPPVAAPTPVPVTEPQPPLAGQHGSSDETLAAETEKPLPTLDDSDTELIDVLTELYREQALVDLFQPKNLVRRIVVTIDNASRGQIPEKIRPLKSAAGPLLTQGDEDHKVVSPENYQRYARYMDLAEAVNVARLMDLYIHYYPLFQEAFLDLGYPSGYFNDRLVEVIDHLLATPKVQGPVQLLRPHVLYQYADPALEALSAGQKLLIRIGPDNAARIKARLRALRQEVTRFAPAD